MANEIYDYCIVGSGPVSASILAKIPSSASIVIIDRGELAEKKTILLKESLSIMHPDEWDISDNFIKSTIKPSKFEAKPYFGDTYSYKYDKQKKSFIPESVGFGGFSKVWGATVFPYLKEDLNDICKPFNLEFSDEFTTVDSFLKPISCFGFNDAIEKLNSDFPTNVREVNRGTFYHRTKNVFNITNSVILPGVVAVNYPEFDNDENGCTKCGICQVGCPYDFIWSSDNLIRNNLNHIKYIKGEVINCTKNQNGLEIITYQQGQSTLKLTSKKIFLCGGAIGNSKILLRTFSNINRITIRDNQTKIIAGLKLRANTPATKDSLAEFMVFDRSKKNKVITQGQFYTNSRYLKTRMISEYPFLTKLPKFLLNQFFLHFFTALTYHSQNASGEIIVGNINNINIITKFSILNKLRNKSRNFRFALLLFFRGLVTIPFVGRNLGIGGGGHIGSIRLDPWTDTDIQRYFRTGKIDENREIYAFGTSSLPILVPGPVTYMAMVNTTRQVKLVINA
jgi:hypothetical protein